MWYFLFMDGNSLEPPSFCSSIQHQGPQWVWFSRLLVYLKVSLSVCFKMSVVRFVAGIPIYLPVTLDKHCLPFEQSWVLVQNYSVVRMVQNELLCQWFYHTKRIDENRNKNSSLLKRGRNTCFSVAPFSWIHRTSMCRLLSCFQFWEWFKAQ